MGSPSSHNQNLTDQLLTQLIGACDFIITWNANIESEDDYLASPNGMEKMAATCMLLESIGEGVKKIDRLMPDFMTENAPEIPWKQVKGLRDHIAHGYFDLDASIIFDVAVNEIPNLKAAFEQLKQKI